MAYTPALILLSLVKVRLSLLLTLCHLAIWLDGSVPFRFGKGGFGILANCSRCSTEATLSFSPGLVCSSFSLKPAPFFKLSAGLGITNKSATSLLFFFPPTLALLATRFSSPPFLLPLTLWQIWQEVLSEDLVSATRALCNPL